MKKILSLHPPKGGLINKFFLPFLFSLLIFDFASATDYYWHPSSGTTWGTLANWRTGSYSGSSATVLPTSSDNVFIGNSTNNFTVDLNINDTINDLSIIDGGQIFINTSASKVLYVMGNLTSSNSATTGGGSATIRMNSSGSPSLTGNSTATGKGKLCNLIIDVSGTVTLSNYITMGGSTTLTYTAGTVAAGTSTVAFYNANTISGSFTFYDVEFIGSSNTVTVSANQTVTHDVTLNGSSAITINSNQIDVQGNINDNNSSASSGGSTTFNLTSTNNQTISSSVSAGQGFLPNVKLSKSSGTVTLSGGVISIAGDWTNNYSYSSISYGTSELYFQKSAATVTLGGTYSTPVYKLTLNGNTTTYSLGRDSVFVVKNDLNFRNTSALTINSHNLYAEGNILLNNSNSSTGGSAEIVLHGAANQTITSNVSAGVGSLPNVKLQKSGGTVTLSGAITIGGSWTNNFSYSNISYGTSELYFQKSSATITIGGSYSTPVYRLTLNGNTSTYDFQLDSAFVVNDTFKLRNTGTYTISNHSIYAKGHIVMNNSNSSSAFNSTLYLKGTANQYLKGTNDLKVANLVINKSAGTVTLNKTLTVTGSVTFTNGNIVSSSTNLLIFNDNATVTGASDNSFVDGPVKKVGNDSFTYPTGKSGTYRSIAISAPSTTSDAFTAEYFGVKSSTTAIASPITYTDPCEYWNLTHTTGSATVNVTLGWSTPCFHIASLSYFKVGYVSSGTWTTAGTCTTTGNTTTGTITTSTARNTWGDITLAKTNALVTANAGSNAVICGGSSSSIGGSPTGSGGTSGLNYSWSPSTGLSSSTTANPTASPKVNTTYIVTVTDGITEFAVDTVLIASSPAVLSDNDKVLCPSGDAYLGSAPTAQGGTGTLTYSWSPSIGIDTATIENPHCTTTVTTTYTLTVTDSNSCVVHDTVTVTVSSAVIAYAGNDTTVTAYAHVKLGSTVMATGGSGTYSFSWSATSHIDSPSVVHPLAKLPRTETLTLNVADENGCGAEDEVVVTVSNPLPVIDSALGGLPFIENVGQVIDTAGNSITAIKFKSDLSKSTLVVYDTALTVVYSDVDTSIATDDTLYLMNILFDHANTGSMNAVAGDTMNLRGNYYLGYMPDYYTDVRTSRFISYTDMYSGIDAYLFNTEGQMNWHFIVDTTGNYSDISLNFQGADTTIVDTLGNVYIVTPLGMQWWSAPFVTQEISGRTDTLTSSYTITGNHLSLSIASHNPHHPIDIYWNKANHPPNGTQLTGIYMDWSSYFGGMGNDNLLGISSIYPTGHVMAVCGSSESFILPTNATGFGYQSMHGGFPTNVDAVVGLFDEISRQFTYFTYWGGSENDYARDITIDRNSAPGYKISICGITRSGNTFPLINPGGTSYFKNFGNTNGIGTHGFAVVLNYKLWGLWATFLKGTTSMALALDYFTPSIALVIVGTAKANSGNTQTGAIFDVTPNGSYGYNNPNNGSYNQGGEDATIMQFNYATYHLDWSAFLGGSNNDRALDIAFNDIGGFGITGATRGFLGADDFPTTANAQQPIFGGGLDDDFATYFTHSRQLFMSTYIGGSNVEGDPAWWGTDIQPSVCSVAFFHSTAHFSPTIMAVAGLTASANFPLSGSVTHAHSGSGGILDAYLRVYRLPNVLIYSTCLGGPQDDQSAKVGIADEAIYIGGWTFSSTFPTASLTLPSFQDDTYNDVNPPGGDAFITRYFFDPSGNQFDINWSAFIGGPDQDILYDMSIYKDPSLNRNKLFFVGTTNSPNGEEITSAGSPPNNNFPLCQFDNASNFDFWQQWFSCPQNNGPPCVGPHVYDGFIMCFVEQCIPCLRIEDSAKEFNFAKAGKEEELLIYPNPTSDECYIRYDNPNLKQSQFILYDLVGVTLISEKINCSEVKKIDIRNLSAGIYFAKAGTKTIKIVKQ